MNALEQLNGQTLCSVSEDLGTHSFTFSDCVLAAYTPVSSSEAPAAFVGLKVVSVSYMKDEAITVAFERGAKLSISLKPEHYVGPEAFCAKFKGVCVVE